MDRGPEDVTCKEVDHGSDHYWQAVELRRQVLRLPLGLDYTPEQLESESDSRHLVAVDSDSSVIGYLMLDPPDAGIIKMRQVAVSPDLQGRGIGRKLVSLSEEIARQTASQEMVLHAREVALQFYERLGYEAEGEPFEEVGLRHWRMRKSLA